ncbi:MAG: cation transporter [Anaerolineae bacterium]|jgi:divalent metal cation (Fe/Co/Zn/Cd) transporter|nr:cation transporter [Anaerolineae bacterium]MBT7073466.1 cation transporter [Anaerolineae bacterium]MBT7782890.1 cation transporter [Anaerolineae bacterium]
MENKLYQRAWWLAIITVAYNLIEGLVAIYFGVADETLALFGFGVDSFIEVLSGLGIIAMITRIRRNPNTEHSQFEITALKITGTSFYILAIGLGATVIINLVSGHQPETTLSGLIISLISIATMWLLIRAKRDVGEKLNSAPILADANCTLVCLYMSLILLVSSAIYQLTGFGFIDSLGAIGLIYFSFKEGKEAFEKARGIECSCED